MSRQMPVPNRIDDVAAAHAPNATNGSSDRLYISPTGPPSPGKWNSDSGMCVCSGTQNDSNPACSAATASSTGEIDGRSGRCRARTS